MKNILITGISKGLGLTTTKYLVKKGYFIYGINRTITPELTALIRQYPDLIKIYPFDLSQTEAISSLLLGDFINLKTPLHGFVNNAAFAYDDIVTNINYELLIEMYKVNVFTPFILTKYVIRNMILHQVKGSIVHLSSISVHTGYKGLAMYAATKGSLEAFSKNTAREWGGRGIRSNCIVSGFMDTNMSSKLDLEQKDRIYKRTSLKKPTEQDSVASTIEFLLSDNSKSITGQNIFVDSGTI